MYLFSCEAECTDTHCTVLLENMRTLDTIAVCLQLTCPPGAKRMISTLCRSCFLTNLADWVCDCYFFFFLDTSQGLRITRKRKQCQFNFEKKTISNKYVYFYKDNVIYLTFCCAELYAGNGQAFHSKSHHSQ